MIPPAHARVDESGTVLLLPRPSPPHSLFLPLLPLCVCAVLTRRGEQVYLPYLNQWDKKSTALGAVK
eukprot:563587-Rhodomonas_salina.1